MSFYSIYRIVKDITRTIFGYKFWRKLLIIILVAFGLWFFLHNQGYCVEETEDINYQVYSYYDGVFNDFIIRIYSMYTNNIIDDNYIDNLINQQLYVYYGNQDGSSYLGGVPLNNRVMYVCRKSKWGNYLNNASSTAYDYLGVTGYSIYQNVNAETLYQIVGVSQSTIVGNNIAIYCPSFIATYTPKTWEEFCNYWILNDKQAIVELLEDIKSETQLINENLTSTDYDDSVVSISSDTIDNVASSTDGMFTTIFTNFNNAVSGGVSQLEIPLPHTEQKLIITSDIVSSHLGGLTYLVQAFWMYVFGLYTWRFVNNLIHRIKDGSILDGFKTDGEVITNTML